MNVKCFSVVTVALFALLVVNNEVSAQSAAGSKITAPATNATFPSGTLTVDVVGVIKEIDVAADIVVIGPGGFGNVTAHVAWGEGADDEVWVVKLSMNDGSAMPSGAYSIQMKSVTGQLWDSGAFEIESTGGIGGGGNTTGN